MRSIIIIIFIFFPLYCFGQQERLSYDIYKKQKEYCENRNYLKIFEYNRNKIGWINEIEEIEICCDTIYMIEEYRYDVEFSRETYSATMWRKSEKKYIKNKMIYKFQSYYKENGNIELLNDRLFSNYILYLVDEWKIEQIKEGEQKNKAMYPSDMIATRIILQDGCKQIETICFNEFTNMDMDNKYDSIIKKNEKSFLNIK
jgi:hypothetical protein